MSDNFCLVFKLISKEINCFLKVGKFIRFKFEKTFDPREMMKKNLDPGLRLFIPSNNYKNLKFNEMQGEGENERVRVMVGVNIHIHPIPCEKRCPLHVHLKFKDFY